MNEGSASPSPSSSFQYYWHYDVFLSFNGGDSCSDFARNLCCALWERGIRTFLGDELIIPNAAQAIRESRNAIVVFSENYASSLPCLKRLVRALNCVKGKGRFIWPLFYRLDPSDVQHQTECFKDAFDQYDRFFDDEFCKNWRSAFTHAADLSGWCFEPSDESREVEMMEEIIQQVSEAIDIRPLHVAPVPVPAVIESTVEATVNGGGSASSFSSYSSTFRYDQYYNKWKFDVFLSFHGGDGCSNFARDLYNALCARGIHTFLAGWERIMPDAAQIIRQCRGAIVIFSENYASSSFCLQHLVQILDCFRGNGGFIWPVFYHVDPSHVRHPTGSYKVAFDYYERFFDDMLVKSWRSALIHASTLAGWQVDPRESNEHAIMKEIIRRISKAVNFITFRVTEFPVGIESRVKEVWSLLNGQPHSDGATMLGIYGVGGVGKSTLARAVYNLIACQFEHFCFLHNVREKSIHDLQKELLSKTTGDTYIGLRHGKSRTSIIKYRLRKKKVLLILDHVRSPEQLKALAGEPNWFGSGSMIIITTRDKHMLENLGINRIYEVQGLNKDEARKLLVWKAFRSKEASHKYEDVISRAVDCAGGLPLALEVLGSNLYGRKVHEWESTLDLYEKIPNRHVYEILKISYDCLEEKVQEVFLDIARFYKGCKLKYATNMLRRSHGFRPQSCIRALIDKSLVKIDESGFLKMQDLIQDMGREIVRQESTLKPEKRIRLWFSEDTLHVLEECTGTDEIQAIKLDSSYVGEEYWCGVAFHKIKSLKLPIIINAKFFGALKSLPSGIRVLDWMNYPSTTLLSFQWSYLRNLKIERNDILTELPDLSGASNLEVLSVAHCKNLMEIDSTAGHHANLRELRARGCTKLTSVLEDGINFPSLEILDLTGCSNFQKFPEILGKMENMKTLALSGTAIETLPESIENLTGLECLYLYNCRRLCHVPVDSIHKLTKLVRLEAGSCGIFNCFKDHEVQGTVNLAFRNITRLHLNGNNISDQLLAVILRWFPRIQVLELRGNDFTVLPACIEECHSLKRLYLDGCKQLQEIRGIPPNIKVLSAVNCTSLTNVSCSGLLSQILQVPGNRKFILPGGRVPEWIHCFERGSSVSLGVRNKFPEIAVCVVFDVRGRGFSSFKFEIRVLINGTHSFNVKTDVLDIECGHIYLFDDLRHQSQEFELKMELLGKKFNNVQISCSAQHKNASSDAYSYVKYIGVYVYNDGSCADDIQFKNPRRTLEDVICDEDCNFSVYSDSSRKDRLYYKDCQATEAPGGGNSHEMRRGGNGEMGSEQRGNRWYIWFCTIVSSVVLYRYVFHLLWLIHQSLGRFLSFMGYMEL